MKLQKFYVYWMAKDEDGGLHLNRELVEADEWGVAVFKAEQVLRERPGFVKVFAKQPKPEVAA